MRLINSKKLLTYSTIIASLAFSSCQNSQKVYNPDYDNGYYILTPPTAATPRINGAEIFGVRPNAPFLYTIAATGQRPMTFSAENLPKGLSLDKSTGIIKGCISDNTSKVQKNYQTNIAIKEYKVKLTASNALGSYSRDLTIKVGAEICLTPPMGWSSWIATKKLVSQDKVLDNALAIKKLGLDRYGYNYVNIDDAWQGKRGGKYNAIMPNEKFPDIQALSDTIHAMGLKFGIYSTPWITSYAGYVGESSNHKNGYWDKSMLINFKNKDVEGMASRMGKYTFYDEDSRQWAQWGVDYMKYDWNPNDSLSIATMSEALANSGRDIVFAISNSCPMEQGETCRRYAQVFRTGGDIRARWNTDGSHINLVDNYMHHNKWIKEGFEGCAGHIPDPDFLMVGLQKYGSKRALSADELYSHVSSYALWGAPFLLSCNLISDNDSGKISNFGEFEKNLVTNLEILDIDQDRLVKPGKEVYNKNGISIIVKDLANGDKAFGIFNFNPQEVSDKAPSEDEASTLVTISWKDLGLTGPQVFRDVWRQKNIGIYKNNFTAAVRPHGVVVIRASRKNK